MKRIILAVIICMLFAAPVFAGCTVTKPTFMFLSVTRMLAFDKMVALNESQAWIMLGQDLRDGDAVMLDEGTPVELVERINKYISIVSFKGTNLIAVNHSLKCN